MGKSNHKQLAELLQKQISQTEWFSNVDHEHAEGYKIEDAKKMERLGILHETIGLGYDEPTFFTTEEVLGEQPKFTNFCKDHPDELWAIRLSPLSTDLPKIRTRGIGTDGALDWIKQQDFDPKKYEVIFRPHPPDRLWATTFVVNRRGIHGAITAGDHSVLTQGIYWDGEPMTFSHTFEDWTIKPADDQAAEHLLEVFKILKVSEDKQAELKEKVDGTFSNGYLNGYFETVESRKYGIWFFDYNRMIGEMYADYAPGPDASADDALVTGRQASAGTATGAVQIVAAEDVDTVDFTEGNILVCKATTPDYAPIMRKAAAIVTDQGGILSHAAIVARELGVPCVVGTKQATELLADGQQVEVNADQGVVLAAE